MSTSRILRFSLSNKTALRKEIRTSFLFSFPNILRKATSFFTSTNFINQIYKKNVKKDSDFKVESSNWFLHFFNTKPRRFTQSFEVFCAEVNRDFFGRNNVFEIAENFLTMSKTICFFMPKVEKLCILKNWVNLVTYLLDLCENILCEHCVLGGIVVWF